MTGVLIGLALGAVLVFAVTFGISEIMLRREFPKKDPKDYFFWRAW